MDEIAPPLNVPSPSASRSPFARFAATACLASPLLLIAISFGASFLLKDNRVAGNPLIVLVIGGLSCLLLLAGFILGIVALAMMKRGDRGAVLTRVGLSVLVYGVLIAMAVPNYIRAREASRQLKDSVTGVATATDSARARAASQAYEQHLQAHQAAYEIAFEKLRATKVLAVSNLTDRSQIPARRTVVQDFLDANNRVKTFVSQSEQHFLIELDTAHLSPSATDLALASFRKSAAQSDPIVLQVRDSDNTMGQAMLDVLDLLDHNWGHWHAKNGGKSVVFDRQADLDAYNSALERIDTAKSDQADAQQRLANLVSTQQQQHAAR